jgi:hypothetical protein
MIFLIHVNLRGDRTSGCVDHLSFQISILAELATAVKSGNYTGSFGIPEALVLVGHSFGSVVTSCVILNYLALADDSILTGQFCSQDTVLSPCRYLEQVPTTTLRSRVDPRYSKLFSLELPLV